MSKTQLQKIERRWRPFVFYSRFTGAYFFCGIILFFVAIFTPPPIRVILMERVFPAWFGALLLYGASAWFLTMLVAFTRRDLIVGLFMAFLASATLFMAFGALRLAFVGAEKAPSNRGETPGRSLRLTPRFTEVEVRVSSIQRF